MTPEAIEKLIKALELVGSQLESVSNSLDDIGSALDELNECIGTTTYGKLKFLRVIDLERHQ